MDIETVLDQAREYLPQEDLDLVERAYGRAAQALQKRTRKSGEAYILRSLNVAHSLIELGLDASTVAAGLLYSAVEGADVEMKALRAEFGDEVADLVEGVIDLSGLDESISEREPLRSEWGQQRSERQTENLRKMFLAMVDDPRVILIVLTDRLHNMETLQAIQDEGRLRRTAGETLDIYAPLAGRLGVYRLKWELEDLGFRYVDSQAYADIAVKLHERRQDRERQVKALVERIKQALAAEGIADATVVGRPKHIYSIYKKMQRKGVPFDQIHDVRAVRIIVRTVPQCYHALGVIHQLWHPLPGGFDDYIASPKDNSYRSLHTDVIAEDGKTLEVQIRTEEMDEVAEYGIAAHWKYKERGPQAARVYEKKIEWLQSAIAGPRGEGLAKSEDAQSLVDVMTHDFFQDQVYVFTPRGETVELPVGSTPIDFAYTIHTEVGHRCRGAKVNGRLVSLNQPLKNGDQVEILTAKDGGPSRDWLNEELGYTRTARARTKIRQWFRRQAREQNIERGRELVEKELRRLSLEKTKLEDVAALFYKDRDSADRDADEFFVRVGTGDIQPSTVATRVATKLAETVGQAEGLGLPPAEPALLPTLDTSIRVKSVGNLLTNLARCCNPAPGDPIIGYITRGRGVTVHRQDCPNVLGSEERERLIEVDWGEDKKTYPVRVCIRAYDRTRLLQDIAEVIGNEEVNMSRADITTHKEKKLATFTVVLELTDISQLSRVLSRLEQVPSVLEARRIAG